MKHIDDNRMEEWVILYNQGLSFVKIGKMFSVSGQTVSNKIRGKVKLFERHKNSYSTLLKKVVVNAHTGCWEWTGGCNNKGYGNVSLNGKETLVHRYFFTVNKGEIPKGLFICHKCDNPKCCNPDHLFLGTRRDNINDCIKKGRNGNKLSLEQVKEIKKLVHSLPIGEIAKKFSVRRETISGIKNGKYWKQV